VSNISLTNDCAAFWTELARNATFRQTVLIYNLAALGPIRRVNVSLSLGETKNPWSTVLTPCGSVLHFKLYVRGQRTVETLCSSVHKPNTRQTRLQPAKSLQLGCEPHLLAKPAGVWKVRPARKL
jgi:hypothetical protein